MSKWHLEKLVRQEYCDSPNPQAYIEIFGIPVIKVLVTLIDQENFLIDKLIFILWFWWIDDIPQFLVLVVEIVVNKKSNNWKSQHPHITIDRSE